MAGGGGGTDLGTVNFTWTEGETTPGAMLELWEWGANDFANAVQVNEFALGVTLTSLTRLTGAVYYYWLRYRLPTGDLGPAVPCTENPITYPSPGPL